MDTVREFAYQCYRLINPSNPVITLQGDDQKLIIKVLNQLLASFFSTGLLSPIARTETCPVINGQQEVVCGPSTFTPTPDITAGRLANYDSAWLILDGVTYPLIDQSRDVFLASWKYNPLKGLPRFAIQFQENVVTRIRLYPAPSQSFQFYVRGKFQFSELTANDTMDIIPYYMEMFLLFMTAKYVCMFKARADAWTPKLQALLEEQQDMLEAASEVNLSIVGDKESLLNGNWRVMAGI